MVKFIFLFALLSVSTFANAQTDRNELSIMFVSSPPFFEDGDLNKFIQSNILQTKTQISDSASRIIYVSFWVDTLGNTYNHTILRGSKKEYNEESLRVTKLIKFKKPAQQNGKAIEVRYTVPVLFKKQEFEE